MRSAVYLIRCVPTGRVYVGSACNVTNRWAVHRLRLRRGGHHSPILQNAWVKYGEHAFEFTVIEDAAPADLIVREQHYIDLLRATDRRKGMNICKVAGSPRGTKRTAEQRAQMSATRKGKKFSLEHRQRISEALKGRRPSPQAIAASVAYHQGRRGRRSLTDEQISEVVAAKAQGVAAKELALRYGCSTLPIYAALRGAYK